MELDRQIGFGFMILFCFMEYEALENCVYSWSHRSREKNILQPVTTITRPQGIYQDDKISNCIFLP